MEPLNPTAPAAPQPALFIDDNIRYSLSNAAKWAKFLSILGFIFVGLMVIGAFSIGSILSMLPDTNPASAIMRGGGAMFTIIYLLVALLYFFPCFYLYRFASKAQNALLRNDQEYLHGAFHNLHRLYKFVGVLTIIGLVFYVVALIGIFIGSMFTM